MRQDKESFTLLERKSRHLRGGKKTRKFGQGLSASGGLTGLTPIKEVIDNIFTTSALPIDLADIRIWKVWDGVVGKKIAKHARPSSIKKGVLSVKVTDSVWLQELEFMAETIRERLNTRLQGEAIKKIQLRVGSPQDTRQRDKKGPKPEKDHRLTPERQKQMQELAARIKDKELRSSFRKIIGAAARKKSGDTSD